MGNFEEDKELRAMSVIWQSLSELDEAAINRVLRWVHDKLQLKQIEQAPASLSSSHRIDHLQPSSSSSAMDMADFFSRFNVVENSEKALLIGYWLQVVEQRESFLGADVNDALKNLGYRLPNITAALSSLIKRSPSLVVQLSKQGSSFQARKTYKLTQAGIKHVQGLLNKTSEISSS